MDGGINENPSRIYSPVARWVIPVLPGGELEVLLEAAIDLAQRKVDTTSETCQRFYRPVPP